MQVQTAVQDYLFSLSDFSPQTQRSAKRILHEFATWCQQSNLDLEHVKPIEVRRYGETLKTRIAPKTSTPLASQTRNIYIRRIKSFLYWCAQEETYEDLVTERTAKKIELPKVDQKIVEVFTEEQFNALYAACSTTKRYEGVEQRNKAILCLLIDTGIRASELCALTLDDAVFNEDESFIRVINGKGRKSREVGFGKRTRSLLRAYINRYRKANRGERHLFVNRFGDALTIYGLDIMLYHLRDAAKVTGVRVSAHTFRHTYAVNFLRQGGDLYKLCRLMGHTSVKITERYLQAFQAKDARQGISVLDGFGDR